MFNNLFILYVILFSFACVTPYQQAKRRGQHALNRGDDLAAARAFREACEIKPNSPSCDTASALERGVARDKLRLARAALERGDLEQSALLWRQSRDMSQTSRGLAVLGKQISQKILQSCKQKKETLRGSGRARLS